MASSRIHPDIHIPRRFTTYQSAECIVYSADVAISQCKLMAETLQSVISGQATFDKRRARLWQNKLKGILEKTLPTTRIGLYGASGAGKSSIINALLDGNVVLTSSFGAGTSVVTEISYHADPNLVTAHVKFVSREKWENLVSVVLEAVQDGDDPWDSQEAEEPDGVAIVWSQVEAVYPHLTLEKVSSMSTQDVLASDKEIEQILGTSQHISAQNTREFSRKMGRFLGAGNVQPNSAKRMPSQRGTPLNIPSASTRASSSVELDNRPKTNGAFWPLIERVEISCNAPALSTGAILVDMPGTSDKNPARSRIAMDNLVSCDKIWIFVPIVRAITDKIASDLLGETFRRQLSMGTSFLHEIRLLGFNWLYIWDTDRSYDTETISLIATKTDDLSYGETMAQLGLAGDTALQELEELSESYQVEIGLYIGKEADLRDTREELITRLQRVEERLERQNQRLTECPFHPQKRKEPDQEWQSSMSKRTKVQSDGTYAQSVSACSLQSTSSAVSGDSKGVEEDIIETQHELVLVRKELEGCETQEKEVKQTVLVARAKKSEVDKKMRAICSIVRSKHSSVLLQDSFKRGLRDFYRIETLPEECTLSLPVFCTCATDYAKVKGINTTDGEPTCFLELEDTGIPALQRWCHSLASASRDAVVHDALKRLKSVVDNIRTWTGKSKKSNNPDCIAFKKMWGVKDINDHGEETSDAHHPKSICGHLKTTFSRLLSNAIEELKDDFIDGLKNGWDAGASLASFEALEIASKALDFKIVRHKTVSAVLRRHGAFKFQPNLNEALAEPFLETIEPDWNDAFYGPFLESLNDSVYDAVEDLLKDVRKSAGKSLQLRLKKQIAKCLEGTKSVLFSEIEQACDVIDIEQKKLSRSIATHIQQELGHGYDRANKVEAGTGSVKKRKDIFLDYLKVHKDRIFANAGKVVEEGLSQMVDMIALDLKAGLDNLAEEIDLNIAVMWKSVRDDSADDHFPAEVLDAVQAVMQQVKLWQKVEKREEEKATAARKLGAAGFPNSP